MRSGFIRTRKAAKSGTAIGGVLVVCVLMLLRLTACQNDAGSMEKGYGSETPIDQADYDSKNFRQLLEAGEYQKAVDMYSDTVWGHLHREQEVKETLCDFADSVIDAYLMDDGTYEQAKTALKTVVRVVTLAEINDVETAGYEQRLSEVNASKIAYDSGCKLLELKNYQAAIEEFEKVLEADSQYADAQQKQRTAVIAYKGSVRERVTAALSEENYEEALRVISDAVKTLPEDTDLLTEKATCEKSYVTAALEAANAAFVDPEKDYSKAADILRPAIQKFPDDEELQNHYAYYMTYQPVSLFDRKAYQKSGKWHLGEDEADTRGNRHQKGWYTLSGYLSCGGEAVYDIGKGYNLLRGTLAAHKGSESKKDKGWIKIYGDEKLLYEATITNSFEPQEISVDITGITDLKVKIETTAWSGCDVLFADVTLQKTSK